MNQSRHRKPRPPGGRSVSVTAEMHERLTAMAKREGVTIAKLIERALEREEAARS